MANKAIQTTALSCALSFVAVPHGAAQYASHALAERLSQTITHRMARDDVPGVVVVVMEDGSPVWTRAFGLADPRTGRGMTEDALFRVESTPPRRRAAGSS
ncbi:serine hydrolase [Psychromarinibacter sediminicola]|nr:serine hydrolase [Psychromarinibacter sediminicola]